MVKESTCQHKRCRFDPWVGKIPGVGNGNPLQYSCRENYMDRGAWQALVPGGHKELDTTEHAHTKALKSHRVCSPITAIPLVLKPSCLGRWPNWDLSRNAWRVLPHTPALDSNECSTFCVSWVLPQVSVYQILLTSSLTFFLPSHSLLPTLLRCLKKYLPCPHPSFDCGMNASPRHSWWARHHEYFTPLGVKWCDVKNQCYQSFPCWVLFWNP